MGILELEKAVCCINFWNKNVRREGNQSEIKILSIQKKKKKKQQLDSLSIHFISVCEDQILTIGVEFGARVVKVSEKKVKLQIWDTVSTNEI